MKEFAKGMSSKFLAVLLTLCILLGSVELPAMAASGISAWCDNCNRQVTTKAKSEYEYEPYPGNNNVHKKIEIVTQYCPNCNSILKGPYEGIVYEEDSHVWNGNKCTYCNYVKQEYGHTCDFQEAFVRDGGYEEYNESKHIHITYYIKKCTFSGCDKTSGEEYPKREQEAHSNPNGDGACNKCGYQCPHSKTTKDWRKAYDDYKQYNNEQHEYYKAYKITCDNCGYVLAAHELEFEDYYDHDFDSNGTCIDCGYTSAPQVPSISFTKMSPTTVQVGNKVTFTVETTGDIVEMIIKYYPLDENGNPDTANQKIIRKEYSANATIERSFSEKGDKIISFRARYSGSDEWSAESSQKTLTVTSKGPLDKPVVTAPESVILGNSWNVSWTAVNYADYYRLQITDPNGPTRLLTKEFSGSVHSYTVPADAIKSPVRASVYVIATSNEGYDQAESELVYTTLYACSHTNPVSTEASRTLDQSKTTDSQHVYTVTYNVTCKDCGAALPSETKNETEAHTFNASGVCSVCGYQRINNLTVSVKADKTTAEVGKTIGATATPSGGDGSYNYSWVVKRDGVETYSTTTGYPEHFELVVDVIGQYVLVATVTDGSGNTATAQSESITVKEKQPAVITSFTMKEESVFVGEDVHFTVSTNADEIQIVVKSAGTFDSDIKQVGTNGTVSFTRTFSQAGEREISFHARYQGDLEWGALYDQPKNLKVNELSIPAFSITDVKCASSDNRIGGVGDDVTVSWNAPKWPLDETLQPDEYSIVITGPGVHNEETGENKQEISVSKDETSKTLSGSEFTIQKGKYSIAVYAILRRVGKELKEPASGDGSFSISKAKLNLSSDIVDEKIHISANAVGKVDYLKVSVTNNQGEEKWKDETKELEGGAISFDLPDDWFKKGEVYTLTAAGYRNNVNLPVTEEETIEVTKRDGTIKKVEIIDSGYLSNKYIYAFAEEQIFFVYSDRKLDGVMLWIDNALYVVPGKAYYDAESGHYYRFTYKLTEGTHTITVKTLDHTSGKTGNVVCPTRVNEEYTVYAKDECYRYSLPSSGYAGEKLPVDTELTVRGTYGSDWLYVQINQSEKFFVMKDSCDPNNCEHLWTAPFAHTVSSVQMKSDETNRSGLSTAVLAHNKSNLTTKNVQYQPMVADRRYKGETKSTKLVNNAAPGIKGASTFLANTPSSAVPNSDLTQGIFQYCVLCGKLKEAKLIYLDQRFDEYTKQATNPNGTLYEVYNQKILYKSSKSMFNHLADEINNQYAEGTAAYSEELYAMLTNLLGYTVDGVVDGLTPQAFETQRKAVLKKLIKAMLAGELQNWNEDDMQNIQTGWKYIDTVTSIVAELVECQKLAQIAKKSGTKAVFKCIGKYSSYVTTGLGTIIDGMDIATSTLGEFMVLASLLAEYDYNMRVLDIMIESYRNSEIEQACKEIKNEMQHAFITTVNNEYESIFDYIGVLCEAGTALGIEWFAQRGDVLYSETYNMSVYENGSIITGKKISEKTITKTISNPLKNFANIAGGILLGGAIGSVATMNVGRLLNAKDEIVKLSFIESEVKNAMRSAYKNKSKALLPLTRLWINCQQAGLDASRKYFSSYYNELVLEKNVKRGILGYNPLYEGFIQALLDDGGKIRSAKECAEQTAEDIEDLKRITKSLGLDWNDPRISYAEP